MEPSLWSVGWEKSVHRLHCFASYLLSALLQKLFSLPLSWSICHWFNQPKMKMAVKFVETFWTFIGSQASALSALPRKWPSLSSPHLLPPLAHKHSHVYLTICMLIIDIDFVSPASVETAGTIIEAPSGPIYIGLRSVPNNVWVREPLTAVSGNLVSCHRFLIKNSWDSLTFHCCVLAHLSSCPLLFSNPPKDPQNQTMDKNEAGRKAEGG